MSAPSQLMRDCVKVVMVAATTQKAKPMVVL
jgi:hypothetical protein